MSAAFNALIESLTRELGFESSEGLISPIELTIDDLPLTIAYDARSAGDDVLLYASLGTVPAERELEVYRALLEGNLLWSATADATIGVNSATREAMIAYRTPIAGLDGANLGRLIGYFGQIALEWRAFIAASAEAAAAPTAMPSMDMLRA
ncbi:CesT family type III secretion system chaperone [Chitinimonas lacunae]|uniref:CesT family type III secretion system chaperone n=1 Tax=Chitinimonas lacunae TaxID=1963018 RepID=A0ABV8ML93_9NEIS